MERNSKVYIALLHYPMRNRRGDRITTSVTNLDIHDIARAARSYDVEGFFIVHPSPSQHELVEQVLGYWQEGYGGQYNADRREALERVQLCADLDAVRAAIGAAASGPLFTVATTAAASPRSVGYKELRQRLTREQCACLLLFGTGWGMDHELLASCDMVLDPVAAGGVYNHLSVRSAVSIVLDRLLGEAWFERP